MQCSTVQGEEETIMTKNVETRKFNTSDYMSGIISVIMMQIKIDFQL
jgi:hypothetical protein